MTHQVEWTVPVVGRESIELGVEGLNGDEDDRVQPLYPRDGELRLWVFNVVADDLPRASPVLTESYIGAKPAGGPGAGHRAEHFAVYYDMYPEGTAGPVPCLISDVGSCPEATEEPCGSGSPRRARADGAGADGPRGADPYDCMTAGARLG